MRLDFLIYPRFYHSLAAQTRTKTALNSNRQRKVVFRVRDEIAVVVSKLRHRENALFSITYDTAVLTCVAERNTNGTIEKSS